MKRSRSLGCIGNSLSAGDAVLVAATLDYVGREKSICAGLARPLFVSNSPSPATSEQAREKHFVNGVYWGGIYESTT
jgi:hypothetical protein